MAEHDTNPIEGTATGTVQENTGAMEDSATQLHAEDLPQTTSLEEIHEALDPDKEPVKPRRRLNTKQRMVVAVTFFSMFFGAGNLIFPPYVGALAGNHAFPALVGFILSAVGLPIIGVLAVAKAGGFETLAGRASKSFATFLGIAIILTIGPLFAIPRTASTSFEMAVGSFSSPQNKWWLQLIYSLFFFALSFIIAQHPEKLTSFLGRVMGPILLVMILALFLVCCFIKHPGFAAPSGPYSSDQLLQGFLDGYQTMDLLCALYFGIVIAANIRQMGVKDPDRNRLETGISGLITGAMLMVVYASLGFVGVVSGSLHGITPNKDTGATVLTNLTEKAFGTLGTAFVGIIFIVACFNCCTGLISTCSSFFHNHYPTIGKVRMSYMTWSIIFTAIALVIANAGLSFIIKLTVPILEALYPICIVLVALSLVHDWLPSRNQQCYFWTLLFTAIVSVSTSVLGLVRVFGGNIPWLAGVLDSLPLGEYSMAWLVPALAGFAIGLIISFVSSQSQRNR